MNYRSFNEEDSYNWLEKESNRYNLRFEANSGNCNEEKAASVTDEVEKECRNLDSDNFNEEGNDSDKEWEWRQEKISTTQNSRNYVHSCV